MTKDAGWEGLLALPRAELRRRWEEANARPAPKVEVSLLARDLAWGQQAAIHGGLERHIDKHLSRLCNAAEGALNEQLCVPQVAGAGTRYLREWGGRVHHVEILPSGAYHYDGREWRSLSVIARHITGARWSGPRFFGVAV